MSKKTEAAEYIAGQIFPNANHEVTAQNMRNSFAKTLETLVASDEAQATYASKTELATIGQRVGNLGDLSTVIHSSLVSAINEVYGKVDDLNDIVNNLPSGGSSGGSGSSTPVVNNLTSTSTTSALSAYQGKVLKEAVDGKQPLLTQQDKQAIADLHQDPTVPTKTSELTNDAGFVTSSYHDSTKQNVLTDADKKAIADLHQDPVYTGMTQSTATGGTSTTNQLISAKVLNDTIDNKMGNVNTVLETLLGTGGA